MSDDQIDRPSAEALPETDAALPDVIQVPTDDSCAAFQQRIGYVFRDARLLVMALTHPSWAQQHEGEENNQRLEFLGDSVLALVLAGELYARMPNKREGVLTHSRAALAKSTLLSALALELGVDSVLRLSDAEERNGGRARDSILEDTLESVAGAVFLDSDFETARAVVLGWYGDLRTRLEGLLGSHNPKGRLQELVQPKMGNEAIAYTLIGEEGPPHLRTFRVRVDLCGKALGEGSGASKKEAEVNAARVALETIQGEDLK